MASSQERLDSTCLQKMLRAHSAAALGPGLRALSGMNAKLGTYMIQKLS